MSHVRSRVARGVALSVFIGACDVPTISRPDFAYDPTTLTAGTLYRWTSGTAIHVWVVSDGNSAIDLGIATRSAMNAWNAVPQFAEFTMTSASSIAAANIVIYDRASTAPVAPGGCAFDARGAAGYTYFCVGSGTPARAEHLILSNAGGSSVSVVIRVDRGRVTSQQGYNAVVAHEFGHALGIGAHSENASDVMFGLPTVATPTARDIATLRYVLGQIPLLTL